MKTELWCLWKLSSVLIHLTATSLYGYGLVYQFIYPDGHVIETPNDNVTLLTGTDSLNNSLDYNEIENNSTLPDRSFGEIENNSTLPDRSFAWKWKYLTFWNLNAQFLIFLWFLICDLIPTYCKDNKYLKCLFRPKDVLFHSIAFPIGWFVCLTFWILYAIDRELVTSISDDEKYPILLNHISHTIIAPILLIESALTYHMIPHKILGISLLLIFTTGYLAWMLYLGLALDIWVYGILRVLSWPLMICFILACGVALVVLYFLGEFMHQTLWSKERKNLFYYKQWSTEIIVSKEHDFEDFRIVQGLIKK